MHPGQLTSTGQVQEQIMKTMDAIGSMRDCGAVKLNAISFNGHVFEKIDKWLPVVTSFFFSQKRKKTADRCNRLVSP